MNDTQNNTRLGFIGIIIDDRKRTAESVNNILSEHGEMIVARVGLPYDARKCSVITLIVDADTDTVGGLTGRLGQLEGVQVKSAMAR